MTAEILTCTDTEYHADPCETPSLSASCAHTLLSRSPYHAWLEHPKLGGQRRTATPNMAIGTLMHRLLLGVGNGEIVLIHADSFRGKAAQSERDEAIAAGKTPVLAGDYDDCHTAAEAIRPKLARLGIVLDGESEVKVTWQEGAVQCRGAMDHVRPSGLIYDIKTITSADLDSCAKHVREYGYDVQRAAYVSALSKLRPSLQGRIDFVFIFVEPKAPYCVTPVRLDGAWRDVGDMKWKRACSTWAECLCSGVWPEYTAEIAVLEAKPWDVTRELERQVA